MKTNSYLSEIAEILNRFRPVGGGTYFIYVANKELGFCARKSLLASYTPIILISSRDINDGLTSDQWDTIDRITRDLHSKGLL